MLTGWRELDDGDDRERATGTPWSMTLHRWDIYRDNSWRGSLRRSAYARVSKSASPHVASVVPGRRSTSFTWGSSPCSRVTPAPATGIARRALACIASFIPVKTMQGLLQAFQTIAVDHDLALDLAETDRSPRWAALVKELGLDDRVRFLGRWPTDRSPQARSGTGSPSCWRALPRGMTNEHFRLPDGGDAAGVPVVRPQAAAPSELVAGAPGSSFRWGRGRLADALRRIGQRPGFRHRRPKVVAGASESFDVNVIARTETAVLGVRNLTWRLSRAQFFLRSRSWGESGSSDRGFRSPSINADGHCACPRVTPDRSLRDQPLRMARNAAGVNEVRDPRRSLPCERLISVASRVRVTRGSAMTVSIDCSASESAIAATRFAPASDSGGKNCVTRETRMSVAHAETPSQFRGDHIHIERFGDAPATTSDADERRSRSLTILRRASAKASTSPPERGARASADQLRGPPLSVATTGTPAAIASIRETGMPSCSSPSNARQHDGEPVARPSLRRICPWASVPRKRTRHRAPTPSPVPPTVAAAVVSDGLSASRGRTQSSGTPAASLHGSSRNEGGDARQTRSRDSGGWSGSDRDCSSLPM